MLYYLAILTFVVLWIVLEKLSINRQSFWLPLLTLSLFSGIRNYNVGTDSALYTRPFRYPKPINIETISFSFNGEFGYQLYSKILLLLTNNYFWLFFLSALIIVFSYLSFIKKYSVNYLFSIFLFITLGPYTLFFNVLRQGLAISIVLVAINYLLKRKPILFVIFIILASSFHVSALLLLPLYYLVYLKIDVITKMLLTFTTSSIASTIVIKVFAESNAKYASYTQTYEKASGSLTVSFYVSLLISLYIVSKMYKIKDEVFSKLFTFYAIGIALVLPIFMLGTHPSGPLRILYYFSWTTIILIPIALNRIKNPFVYVITIVICLIYFILTTSSFANLTPFIINPIFLL